MKGTSPTQRTQKFLRDRGMLVAKTEHWNQWARCRQDLFGIVDTIALDPTSWDGMLCIQSTSGSGHSARWNKIMETDATAVLLRHARLELWSWSKKGEKGKRQLWTLRRERFSLAPNGRVLSFPSTDPLNL